MPKYSGLGISEKQHYVLVCKSREKYLYYLMYLLALSSEGVMGEGVVVREGSFTPPRGREGSRDPPPPPQQNLHQGESKTGTR
jgi:hypothetical protein